MAKKKLRVWLENLGIEVPVYQLHEADGQVSILVADVPKKIAARAGLKGKTVRYWYGKNAGGNRLIEDVRVTQKEGAEPIPVEILASSIVEIAAGMKKLSTSRLQDSVLEHLIAWKSGASIVETRKVLDCLNNLEAQFLK